jgi:acyl-CoA synthetase (AMP-forming)/AMP-acid ligase II
MDGGGGPRRIWVDAERFRTERVAHPVAESTPGVGTAATCFVSSGRCLPGAEVQIVSPSGEYLPEGGVGEILIRSDSLFDGYYNRPDLTARALQDGWYQSGDLGFCLEDEIYVVGRKNDMIIVAGKNIYPQDVEEIVSAHPALHDGRAVAFGLYNPDLGTEEIVVVAELEKEKNLKNVSAIERDLRSAIVAELGVAVRAIYFKPLRWVVKSTAGKPARAATREKLLAERPDLSANALLESPS